MKTLKFKDSDLFVDSVKSKKGTVALLILLFFAGFLLFCFFASVSEAEENNVSIYEKDGYYHIHNGNPDKVVKMVRNLNVSNKQINYLLKNETSSVVYKVVFPQTVFFGKSLMPKAERVTKWYKFFLEGDSFKTIELKDSINIVSESPHYFWFCFPFLLAFCAILMGLRSSLESKNEIKKFIYCTFLMPIILLSYNYLLFAELPLYGVDAIIKIFLYILIMSISIIFLFIAKSYFSGILLCILYIVIIITMAMYYSNFWYFLIEYLIFFSISFFTVLSLSGEQRRKIRESYLGKIIYL